MSKEKVEVVDVELLTPNGAAFDTPVIVV